MPGWSESCGLERQVDQLADVARCNGLADAVERSQSLEDPSRLLDPIGVALDADLAVPRQDLHADRVPDLSEVLVATAEDGQLFGMTLQTDGNFRHASPFAGPRGGTRPRRRRGRPDLSPTRTGPTLSTLLL